MWLNVGTSQEPVFQYQVPEIHSTTANGLKPQGSLSRRSYNEHTLTPPVYFVFPSFFFNVLKDALTCGVSVFLTVALC